MPDNWDLVAARNFIVRLTASTAARRQPEFVHLLGGSMRDATVTAPTSPSFAPALHRAPEATSDGRPVLLATDGGPGARATVRVTAALAAERHAVPHVLRVLDISAYAVPAPLPSIIAAADALVGRDVRAPDRDAVRAELGQLLGRRPGWPVSTAIGSPARVIVDEATRLGAELVLMGIRRHDFAERVLRDETTLAVMRRSPCSVLGVAPSLHGLPLRAVVGIDFGRASVHAARAALSVLAPEGSLLLAFIQPPHADPAEGDEGMAVVRELGVDAAFRRLVGELAPGRGVIVEPVVVRCMPGAGTAGELLALGDRVGADLLAVGSQQHGRINRLLLGSVTTDLARDGRHSLLVVPPRRDRAPEGRY
jgi:nucleotide-binding universal stress UspA family protein